MFDDLIERILFLTFIVPREIIEKAVYFLFQTMKVILC